MGIRALVDQSFGTNSVPAGGSVTLGSGEIRPPYFGTWGGLAGASYEAMMVDEPEITFRVNAASMANLVAFQAVLKIQSWPMNSGGTELDTAFPEYSEDVTSVFISQGGNLSIKPPQQGVVRVDLTLTNQSAGALALFNMMTISGLFREGASYESLGLF